MAQKRYVVEFSRFSAKQIAKLPRGISEAINLWREAVERLGLPQVRLAAGYHDELLKEQRQGQRSVRLNRAYRLIYVQMNKVEIVIVGVLEVNKHDY